MTYERASDLLTGRCSNQRKIGNNTYLIRRDNCIVIRLHSTDIIMLYPNGDVELNSGGWQTVTTKARMNEYIPSGRIWSDRGVWYVSFHNRYMDWESKTENPKYLEVPYADGMVIHADGSISEASEDPKAKLKLRKRIFKYADGYIAALFAGKVDKPGAGDCMYCGLHTFDTHISMGEAFQSTDHIESHMKERYYVPSMMMNAIKRHPVSKCVESTLAELWGFGPEPTNEVLRKVDPNNGWYGIAKEQLLKSLRRYIVDQFGMQS